MFKRVINAVMGSRHERERKKVQPIVDEINAQYARLHDVPEDELRGQTARFRETIRASPSSRNRSAARLIPSSASGSTPS